jgi:septum formation protein
MPHPPRPPGFIYLASQSPRRQDLLRQIGVRFELLLPGPEEDSEALEAVHAGESPARYVQRVTALKLQAALQRLQTRRLAPAPVLCADTTVALGRCILGKPADAKEARAMLRALSGSEHRVLTAVAVGTSQRSEQALSVSRVRFAALPEAWIQAYVASGEPMGKAGAYAMQGAAAAMIERVSGSPSGVIGLPLAPTHGLLRRFGLHALPLAPGG